MIRNHYGNIEERNDYVDIHGRDICVLISEKTGDILIPLHELKQTGFNIYRKSQYSKLLVDDSQFSREFNLYMLDCAKTYILKNKITFNENEILASINNCKKILSEDKISPSKAFGKNRTVEQNHATNDFQIKVRAKEENAKLTVQNLSVHNTRSFNRVENATSYDEHNGMKREDASPLKVQPRQETRNGFAQQNGDSKKTNCSSRKSDDLMSEKSNGSKKFNGRSSGGERKSASTVPTITLDNPEHEVVVSSIEPGKTNIAWVQDTLNISLLAQIFNQTELEEPSQTIVANPKQNTIYLAEEDGTWFRCRLDKSPPPLSVFFIDYGNISEVKFVKTCSADLAKHPGLAARISFNQTYYEAKVDDEIRIKPQNRFTDGTYYIHVIKNRKSNEVSPRSVEVDQPKQKLFFNKPGQVFRLEYGQRIGFVNVHDGKLYLRTKETVDKLKQINSAIAALPAQGIQSVEKNQLILAPRNHDALSRATVESIENNSIKVNFIDYCDSETVPLSTLKHISEALSLEPIAHITPPPIKGFQSKKLNDQQIQYLQELSKTNSKAIVQVINSTEFDAKLDDMKLLSQKLKELEKVNDRVLLDDMTLFKPDFGLKDYICYGVKGVGGVTLVTEELDVLGDVILTEMKDTNPHNPVVGEVCWGLFEEMWYRCVVTNIVDGTFETIFIDFGNEETLVNEQLRKITDTAKDIPVLGLPCKFVGLPSKQGIDLLIKQELVEGSQVKANIKAYNNDFYEIEIPLLYDVIKQKL